LATNQGVVGSNPASRANQIKDLRQKWRESFFLCATFTARLSPSQPWASKQGRASIHSNKR